MINARICWILLLFYFSFITSGYTNDKQNIPKSPSDPGIEVKKIDEKPLGKVFESKMFSMNKMMSETNKLMNVKDKKKAYSLSNYFNSLKSNIFSKNLLPSKSKLKRLNDDESSFYIGANLILATLYLKADNKKEVIKSC